MEAFLESTRDKRGLSGKEMDAEIREFLKSLAMTVVPTRGKVKEASKVLGLSESSIEQMRIYGKGSVDSWFKLLMHKYNLSTKDVRKFFDNYKAIVAGLDEASDADRLYQEVRARFSEDELYAWLRLLIAKYDIETELKLRKRKPQ